MKSIPDVLFINTEGLVVDRLRKFDEARGGLARASELRRSNADCDECQS